MKHQKLTLGLLVFSIICLFSLSACDNLRNNEAAQKKEQDALLKKVLDLHDEIMPKMTNLAQAETALEESLKNPAMKSKFAEIEADIKQKVAVDDEMMDWMANFKEDFKGMKHEEVMKYLENEKVKVEALKVKILAELQ